MFALDQKAKSQSAVIDNSDFLEGYDPKDILSLTCKGNLQKHFGEEGSEYEYEECPIETRVLKHTTAGKYIQKDEAGNWKLNPNVEFDEEHNHGLYSMNNSNFPFVVRPYKYMCLRNGRDARADIILLELFEPEKWEIYPIQNFNEEGALVDRDTDTVLVHAKDTIIDKNMKKTEFMDETVAQWEIDYPIKKVLKLKSVPSIGMLSSEKMKNESNDTIHRKFEEFNQQMFAGKLPKLPIELSDAKTFLEACVHRKRRLPNGEIEMYDFRLRINTRIDLPKQEVEDTIIHE